MNGDCNAHPVRYYSAVTGTDGALEVDGLKCFTRTAASTCSCEAETWQTQHSVMIGLTGQIDKTVEESWDGANSRRHHVSRIDFSLIIPSGQRYISTHRGTSSLRYAAFHIEPSAFVNALGGGARQVELKAYHGPRLLQRGVVERFDAVCHRPDDFPLAYKEALSAVLLMEVYGAHGTQALPQPATTSVGAARFRLVLDYIEENIDSDVGLSELAALAGLSVTHFAHAFRSTYHMPPYRYILERRIARAKGLLRTSSDSIAMIATRVGFSSQSRFSTMFSRLTGMTPSHYRLAGGRFMTGDDALRA